MNPNPIRTASHIGLWIVVVLIGAWLVYSATHTSTENNKYASGSNPIDYTSNGIRLVDKIDLFNFSCAREGLKDEALHNINGSSPAVRRP
jgi:hypothetical protein